MRSGNGEKRIQLIIEGLRRPGEHESSRVKRFNFSRSTSLDRVWRVLESSDYLPPVVLRDNANREFDESSIWRSFHEFQEVQVVKDKSAADKTHVYVNEPLAACNNREQEVQFEILDSEGGGYADRHANSLGIDGHLTTCFHRTVRMPDDNRLHHLPSSLGTFPLYNVVDYADRLPDNILKKGGVFLPMWQREALWMSFHTTETRAYAIRVYIGHINALTGQNMMKRSSTTNQQQDYVVVPGQHWVDGVYVSPGVVRQFVAMPLGSGYTVEGQKTGEEKHGGLQIEVIPAYRQGLTKWLRSAREENSTAVREDDLLFLDDSKTPASLGLKPGDRLRSCPPDSISERPMMLGDLKITRHRGEPDAIYVKALYADSDYEEGSTDEEEWISDASCPWDRSDGPPRRTPSARSIMMRQDLQGIGAWNDDIDAQETRETEKNAAKKRVSRERRRGRSRSRNAAPAETHPVPSRNSARLIEYGNRSATSSIPVGHYYGQPTSLGGGYCLDRAEYDSQRHEYGLENSPGGRYSGHYSGRHYDDAGYDSPSRGRIFERRSGGPYSGRYYDDAEYDSPPPGHIIERSPGGRPGGRHSGRHSGRYYNDAVYDSPSRGRIFERSSGGPDSGRYNSLYSSLYCNDDVYDSQCHGRGTLHRAPRRTNWRAAGREQIKSEPDNVKAMGLAAGGKLIQDIYRDPHPPSIWNVAAARMINVHILSPTSCEEITHIVPPPIPMDAYEYIEKRLPFFVVNEQIDDRLDGGGFDDIKSVSQMDENNGVNAGPRFDPSQPTICRTCESRLCDCIVRPCDHQFCNVCIRQLEDSKDSSASSCPQCSGLVSRVVGFSAPMNLPGEESVRSRMPVRILQVNDGRVKFESVRRLGI